MVAVFIATGFCFAREARADDDPTASVPSATTQLQLNLTKEPYRLAIASATNVEGQTVTKNAILNSTAGANASMIGVIEDQLQVSFNTPNGYEVYVSMSSTSANQRLTNTTDNTKFLNPIGTGSMTTPGNLATQDTWGIAVPSQYNSAFDADTYYSDANITTSTKFAPIPTYSNEGKLFSRNSSEASQAFPEEPDFPLSAVDTIPVFYGYNASVNLPTGSYTNKVLYTVIAEGAMTGENEIVIYPTQVESLTGGQTLTIATDFYVPSSQSLGTGYVSVTVGGQACTNVTRVSEENTDAVTLTCTLPALATKGRYTVVVNFDKYNRTMTLTNGIIYGDGKSTLTVAYGTGVASVTVDSNVILNNGTVSLDWGSTHDIDMTFESGYEFNGWSATDGMIGSASTKVTTYTIGENNATLTANGKSSKLYMQNLTASQCNTLTSGGTSNLTVYDQRDEKDYTVSYLDGKCWMTSNLRFTGTSITTTNTNSDADKTITWYDLTTGSSSSGACYGSYSNGTYSGNGWTNMCKHEGNDNLGNPTVWYNYAAATAKTIATKGSNTTEASYSICPYGWRLPTNAENGTLRTALNASSTLMDVFSPVYGGYYYSGSLYGASNSGFWWSSTAGNGYYRYGLYYYNGSLYTYYNSYRYYGYYVRCVRSS